MKPSRMFSVIAVNSSWFSLQCFHLLPDGFFLLFQAAHQWGQFIVNLTGLRIIRVHLIDRCHDPLRLKLGQDQDAKYDQNTHGNHNRNSMYYRGQRALCGAGYAG